MLWFDGFGFVLLCLCDARLICLAGWLGLYVLLQDKIILYTLKTPRRFTASPFTAKLEVFLHLSGLPFEARDAEYVRNSERANF